MNVNDLPSVGDIPNAIALRRELAKALNYLQLTSRASPGTVKARVASLRKLMIAADGYMAKFSGESLGAPKPRKGKAQRASSEA